MGSWTVAEGDSRYFSRSSRLKKAPGQGAGRSRRAIPGVPHAEVGTSRTPVSSPSRPWLSLRLSLVFRPPLEFFLALPLDVERASKWAGASMLIGHEVGSSAQLLRSITISHPTGIPPN